MKQKAIGLAVAAALLATPALAVKAGDTLYIRSKDASLLKTPAAPGSVLTKLQPGTEVTWNGVDAKDKNFHKVKAAGKDGYVLQVNLSPAKPSMEVASDGKPTTMSSLASSGAATRTLSEVGQKQAAKTPDLTKAGKQVVLLEGINDKITPKDLVDHAKKQGLPKAGGK